MVTYLFGGFDPLEREGYRVEAVGTIGAARERLEDHTDDPPVLVVSDVVLPDGSGREIARLVAERFLAASVVLMSGYAEEMVDDTDAGPADRFIPKPFSPEELIEIVREVRGRALRDR